MVDIHSILATHKQKDSESHVSEDIQRDDATVSEIPDLFFDEILVKFKLTRIEILVLMYIYRRVWCRPNLYKKYGISQLMSITDMVSILSVSIEEAHNALRKLENFGFISTIRVGQYFVRRFFTKELDEVFGQTYDDFEV